MSRMRGARLRGIIKHHTMWWKVAFPELTRLTESPLRGLHRCRQRRVGALAQQSDLCL
jgi:hypothetical protein